MNNAITRVQIDYYLALIRHGQFALAAHALHISQPALTMQIQKLEEHCGGALVYRKRKPLQLTALGERLLPHFKSIQNSFGELENLLSHVGVEIAGHFRVAAIPTIAPYVLPKSISAYVANFPNVTLEVEEMPTHHLLQALHEERLDAGIMALPIKESLKGLAFEALWTESLWAYHPVGASQGMVTEDQWSQWPVYVLTQGHCLRDHVVGLCGQQDLADGGMNFQAGNLDTLMRLVDERGGMTVIPDMARNYLSSEVKLKQTSSLSAPHAFREIVLVWNPKIPYKKSLINSLKSSVLGTYGV